MEKLKMEIHLPLLKILRGESVIRVSYALLGMVMAFAGFEKLRVLATWQTSDYLTSIGLVGAGLAVIIRLVFKTGMERQANTEAHNRIFERLDSIVSLQKDMNRELQDHLKAGK